MKLIFEKRLPGITAVSLPEQDLPQNTSLPQELLRRADAGQRQQQAQYHRRADHARHRASPALPERAKSSRSPLRLSWSSSRVASPAFGN